MSKPPTATPHSDIDGVREDEKPIPDAAIAAGHDSGDLERARKESIGRPDASKEKSRDDRAG